MLLKVQHGAARRASGVLVAQVPVSPSVLGSGMPQVTASISAVDAFDIPSVVLSLFMTTMEAREMAARLVAQAEAAEALVLDPTPWKQTGKESV